MCAHEVAGQDRCAECEQLSHAVPPLSTDIRPVRYSVDSATPRAQDLQDMLSDPSRIRSSSANSLESKAQLSPWGVMRLTRCFHIEIVETGETEAEPDYDSEYVTWGQEEDSDIRALRTALQECWTLCNTLANLSSNHRARVFHSSDTPNAHEKAWKTCWKLCQRLYDNRDEVEDSFNVRANLDLCRDFCQALFDIRQRKDEIADSVLRVSFELNNQYVLCLCSAALLGTDIAIACTVLRITEICRRLSGNGPLTSTLPSATGL